jgi:3-oxoacyl-[acyl-carrier protein] reductase
MSGNLDGRRALITGAGGGMGRSHAVLMAERGADVVVLDIKADGVEETAEMARAKGVKATAIAVDARDVDALTAAVRGAGPVDILVNNAGVGGHRRTIEDIDLEIFNEMYDVQVRGAFFTTKAVVPAMKERKFGKIVNISSIFAMGGSATASHYCSAKSAISGLTKAWAREFAPWRIRVNAVAPGFIVTGMTTQSNTDEWIEEHRQRMPLGEFATPLDISYAVAWLAGPETDSITGQVVSPNAGEVIVGY